MSRINWARLMIGGVIAALIAFLTDGVFHEHVVSADWKALHDTLGIPELKHSALGVLYFAVFELGRGLVSMFLYVAMRPHFKPGSEDSGSGWNCGLDSFLSHRPRAVHSAGILLEHPLD